METPQGGGLTGHQFPPFQPTQRVPLACDAHTVGIAAGPDSVCAAARGSGLPKWGLEWRRHLPGLGASPGPCLPTQSRCFTPGGSQWYLPAHTKRPGRAWGRPAAPHILGLSFYLGMGLCTPRAHQEWFLKSAGVGRERQANPHVAWAVLWGSDGHRGGGPSFLRTGWAGTCLDA